MKMAGRSSSARAGTTEAGGRRAAKPSPAAEKRTTTVSGVRRVTMTDVATLAGVSQSSVSLALNNITGIRLSDATRQRVFDAARELGYRLPGGRAPSAEKTPGTRGARANAAAPLLLYLVDEISTSPHPVVSIDGAKDAAWEQGAVVAVFATRANSAVEDAVLAGMLNHPALVGVIYSAIFTRPVELPAATRRVPTVLLNCYEAASETTGTGGANAGAPEGAPAEMAAARVIPAARRAATGSRRDTLRCSSVVPAEVAGGHMATETLIEAGHRRIAFINGEPWMDAARDRLSGYRRALASHDIAYDAALVREGDWQLASGYEHTLSLMRLKPRPSAIFCANDLMALGCLEALRKLDLAVPGAISVIGYDDQEVSRHTHPPLTTLVLPSYEMGRLAVEMLLAEARDPASLRRRLKVEGRIVERASVGPPPRPGKRR